MFRNLLHAAAGAALILAEGWLVAQRSMSQWMAAHHYARYAALGLFLALGVFTAASIVRAFRPKPAPPGRGTGGPFGYAGSAASRRGR
jgi:hypothetical protein